MSFKEILKRAWKEYTENFDAFFKVMIVLGLIPHTLLVIMSFVLARSSEDNPLVFLLLVPFFLITAVAGFYLYGTLFKTLATKTTYSFKDFFKFSRMEFFYFIGFLFVGFSFLLGLFLLLVIPGIIFLVYWIFSPYIFFKEKKSILGSLEESKALVKGKWWRVLGYSLLLMLVILPFAILILPSLASQLFSVNPDLINLYTTFYLLSTLLSIVSSFTYSLIAYPLTLLFYKHFYYSLKNAKK